MGACVVSLESVLEMVRRTAGGGVDADAPLMEAGVDSLGAVELRNQLQRAVGEGLALSSTLMFDHPTARQVALHLEGNHPVQVDVSRCDAALVSCSSSKIAVAGVSVVLPAGVSAAEALLRISHCGRNLLCVIPPSRWDVEKAAHDLRGSPPEVASRVRHGAFLRDAEL